MKLLPTRATTVCASAIVATLIAMVVIGSIAAVTISRIGVVYRSSFHSESWEEALRAAEAAAELGMTALNESTSSDSFTKDHAWDNWTGTGPWTRPLHAGTVPALAAHAGEGNTNLWAKVEIREITGTGLSPKSWYRIRAVGTAEVPGSSSVTEEATLRSTSAQKDHYAMLRRIRFKSTGEGSTLGDVTNRVLKVPQVSRAVELVAQATHARLFQRALTTRSWIRMSGTTYTDSFDHRFPGTKAALDGTYGLSTLAGAWGRNGHVGSNALGNLTDLNNNLVFGNAMSNGGSILDTGGVKGSIVNNFRTELPDVKSPDKLATNPWTVGNYTVSGAITTATDIQVGSAASPTSKDSPLRIQTNKIDLGNSEVLHLVNPTPGTNAYVEIWSTGIMRTNAQALITMDAGVNAKFFVAGNFDIGGGGVNNLSSFAESLLLYGITPTDGSTRTFELHGSGNFTGVIYTPDYDLTATGGSSFQGAIVSKTANLSGNAGYHYDEALGVVESDAIGGYQAANWVEDVACSFLTPDFLYSP